MWVIFDDYGFQTIRSYIGVTEKIEILKLLGIALGGVLLMIQANISNNRNKISERGLNQERLKVAIEHLGSDKDSIRLGALYELFHLAKNTSDLRNTICDIICAHIRDTTNCEEYKTKYEKKCSTEIRTAIDLLFNNITFNGCQKDLSNCYLVKVVFHGETINNVNFHYSNLEGSSFFVGEIIRSSFLETNLNNIINHASKLTDCLFHETTGFSDLDFFTMKIQGGSFDPEYETVLKKAKEAKNILYIQLKNIS